MGHNVQASRRYVLVIKIATGSSGSFQASGVSAQGCLLRLLACLLQASGTYVQAIRIANSSSRAPVQIIGMPIRPMGCMCRPLDGTHVLAIRIAIGPPGYLFRPVGCLLRLLACLLRPMGRMPSLWDACSGH